MPKGRPNKGKRMVDTNVRVTKDTHEKLKTLATLRGKTISEAIEELIDAHAPEVNKAILALDEIKKQHSKN